MFIEIFEITATRKSCCYKFEKDFRHQETIRVRDEISDSVVRSTYW